MEEVKAKVKKPFYKKWWVWVIAIIVIIGVSNAGKDGSKTTSTSNGEGTKTTSGQVQANKEEEKKFKIGDTVKVGDIEYIVSDVKDSKSIGTSQYLKKETDSNFVTIKVTVKNTGDKAKTIDTSMFKLKDSKGTVYSADAGVDMYANEAGKSFFLQQANPNIPKTGNIVFETPTKNSDEPFTLEVSGGMVSIKSANITLVK